MNELTGNPLDPTRPSSASRSRRRVRFGSWRRRAHEARGMDHEAYPAATVLADLDRIGTDRAAVTAVVARFAALQLVLQATAGVLAGEALAADREMALGYLADHAACAAAERESLSAVVRLAAPAPEQALAAALIAAGAAAAERGHAAGARAYYRTAHELALVYGWKAEESSAARALAEVAA